MKVMIPFEGAHTTTIYKKTVIHKGGGEHACHLCGDLTKEKKVELLLEVFYSLEELIDWDQYLMHYDSGGTRVPDRPEPHNPKKVRVCFPCWKQREEESSKKARE